MQPQLPQTERQRKQQEHWEKVKDRGPVFFIARNISILICIDVFFRMAQASGHLPKWLGLPWLFSYKEVIVDIMTGLTVGAWEWSDMERKFAPRYPAKDSTMI